MGVRGEISNLSRPRSGHVYFLLKDDSAQVRAVLWKSQRKRWFLTSKTAWPSARSVT